MKSVKLLFLLGLFACAGCSSSSDEETAPAPRINGEVAGLLNQAVNIMEENSINKNTIDWNAFRNQVLERGRSAQNISQADDALRLALTLLGDNHSFIRKPNGSIISGANINCPLSALEAVNTPGNIGYVQLPSFSGDQQALIDFAEGIQQSIAAQDSPDILGWIVDLRNNTGGNMWPMLAGIGPILGEGIAGYFIDADNSRLTWSYSNGSAVLNLQNNRVSVANPYELINPNPKVAVLLNKAVASSGEAIAVSFVGRANTMRFGGETCGLSSSNSGFDITNGYTLLLTTAYLADRNQNVFGVPIAPDTPATDETIIQEAINYLSN